MPAKSPLINKTSKEILEKMALCIRRQRQSLGISVVVAAYAAGLSRVTWHRIESAEPSVTIGAYVGALEALGLNIETTRTETTAQRVLSPVISDEPTDADNVPDAIPIQKYRQLRQLAWHVKDDFELTPEEAFGLYDRYRRHLNLDQMEPHERSLLQALESAALKEHHAV